ncbi:MAG: hypothetical protein IKF78_12080 [Atopobiaceae bacterium]|nr:hypothetical protein [Atopobiaceae bacterium]
MGTTIRVSGATLQSVAALLGQGVDEYCSLRLMALSGVAPVAGSTEHDGTMAPLLASALLSYADVMRADGALVRGMGDAFFKTDSKVASAIAGR